MGRLILHNHKKNNELITKLSKLDINELADITCIGINCVYSKHTYDETMLLNELLHKYRLHQIKYVASKILYKKIEALMVNRDNIYNEEV